MGIYLYDNLYYSSRLDGQKTLSVRDGHPVLRFNQNRKIQTVFPVQLENFGAVPIEKLRFFPVWFYPLQPENMRAVPGGYTGFLELPGSG